MSDLRAIANEIDFMTTTPGWRFYEAKLQEEFDKEFKRLRKTLKDHNFYSLRGKLDGLEFALQLTSRLKARGELL